MRGAAQTVADLSLPGTVELAFARGAAAHAVAIRVDAAPARGLPGVAGAWSAADLPGLPPAPGPPGVAFGGPERFALASDAVRFAGEPVAVVAAESRAFAEDAAERVSVVLDELPPLLDAVQAAQPGAPELFPGRPNLVSDREFGSPADDVFASAPVVVTARYRQQLLIPSSLEARAVLARADDDGGFTVWVSHQAQHRLRDGLAAAFGLAPGQVRVVVPMVGGAFGAKSGSYPEYVLACHLARLLGRPVRWTEDRAEALATAPRGRGQQQQVRLAATEDGKLLAYELDVYANVGAYPHTGSAIPGETGAMATGSYRTPRVYARVRTVLTSTPPTSAYRGAGRPEAAFAIERTMDQLARRLTMDPVELRRRNFIREFPYRTPTGRTYDSGNYEAALDKALAAIRYDEVRAAQRHRRSSGAGVPLGVGVACYVERSGGPPDTDEFGSVEVEPDGSVIARSGSTCSGQGHPTVFPQVVATALDIALDRVRLVQNDTREVPYGFATFGSRSLQVGGGALWRASCQLVDEARQRFATACEVDVAGVSYASSRLRQAAIRASPWASSSSRRARCVPRTASGPPRHSPSAATRRWWRSTPTSAMSASCAWSRSMTTAWSSTPWSWTARATAPSPRASARRCTRRRPTPRPAFLKPPACSTTCCRPRPTCPRSSCWRPRRRIRTAPSAAKGPGRPGVSASRPRWSARSATRSTSATSTCHSPPKPSGAPPTPPPDLPFLPLAVPASRRSGWRRAARPERGSAAREKVYAALLRGSPAGANNTQYASPNHTDKEW